MLYNNSARANCFLIMENMNRVLASERQHTGIKDSPLASVLPVGCSS